MERIKKNGWMTPTIFDVLYFVFFEGMTSLEGNAHTFAMLFLVIVVVDFELFERELSVGREDAVAEVLDPVAQNDEARLA